eukprot:2969786-Rhodomonas_salina.1
MSEEYLTSSGCKACGLCMHRDCGKKWHDFLNSAKTELPLSDRVVYGITGTAEDFDIYQFLNSMRRTPGMNGDIVLNDIEANEVRPWKWEEFQDALKRGRPSTSLGRRIPDMVLDEQDAITFEQLKEMHKTNKNANIERNTIIEELIEKEKKGEESPFKRLDYNNKSHMDFYVAVEKALQSGQSVDGKSVVERFLDSGGVDWDRLQIPEKHAGRGSRGGSGAVSGKQVASVMKKGIYRGSAAMPGLGRRRKQHPKDPEN